MIEPSHEFYRHILEDLDSPLYFVNPAREITFWNHAAEKLTGFAASEVLGKPCYANILRHIDEQGHNVCQGDCVIACTIAEGVVRERNLILHHKKGHRIPVKVRSIPIRDGQGHIIGAAETFHDVASGKLMRERLADLERMAMLDPLTGVANRRYLEMSLSSRLSEYQRYALPFGLLFIDIDHFKRVNDAHGHDVGDHVLRMTAQTLSHNLRPFDTLGRWGGEEFLVIIASIQHEEIYPLANRLRILAAASSWPTSAGPVRITISVGATLAQPGDSVNSLVRRADRLMYRSKSLGRNRVTSDQQMTASHASADA